MAKSPGDELNRIEKRALEAQAVVPVLEAVAKRVGREKARAILVEVNEAEAFERGGKQAKETGPHGIDELAEEVASWGQGGVWEMDVLEKTETTYQFNVTRCPYNDKYRELGLEEWGVGLSCCRDQPHASGFNDRLRLERTKTLMEGDDHCDFRYYLDRH